MKRLLKNETTTFADFVIKTIGCKYCLCSVMDSNYRLFCCHKLVVNVPTYYTKSSRHQNFGAFSCSEWRKLFIQRQLRSGFGVSVLFWRRQSQKLVVLRLCIYYLNYII